MKLGANGRLDSLLTIRAANGPGSGQAILRSSQRSAGPHRRRRSRRSRLPHEDFQSQIDRDSPQYSQSRLSACGWMDSGWHGGFWNDRL